jgi:hypothetical protein
VFRQNLYLLFIIYISSLVAGEISYAFLMSKYVSLLPAMISVIPWIAITSVFILLFYAIILIAALKIDLDRDGYTRQGKIVILIFNFFILLILWYLLWNFIVDAFA